MPSDARHCPHCGVDLALVALLAERAYLDGFPEVAPVPTTPDSVVPRIGETLIEQGLLTSEQLQQALDRQKQLADQGQNQLLGQTLLKMGFLDRETLDRAITRQIIDLHAALQEANRTLERRVSERTAELRRALERLTELNQIKANLISNVSHELRTPLAHIKGYVELVADKQLGPLTEDQNQALSVIQRASGRLEKLIEDLIEFSTASREGIRLNPQPVDLKDLATELKQEMAEKAKKASVSIELNFPEELDRVQADPQRLGWVLHQLVDNGVKFTPPGGHVRISAGQSEKMVAVRVEDSGIGITPERINEIFEPFHQLDGSATRRYGGTGLGLALVQLILDAHGADMKVESDEGQGTRFTFQLPTSTGAA
ncbi:MAG: sensor histidine kinase [Anaerolineales bacterium]